MPSNPTIFRVDYRRHNSIEQQANVQYY